jgi:glucan phosphoethanolaminetransferase (alkaline phosphatase superfamily)
MSRIGWEIAAVVGMVVALVLVLAGGHQIYVGMGMTFVIEPTSEAMGAAYVGREMISSAYGYFLVSALIAFVLVIRHWWVWLGLLAPWLIFAACSAVFSQYAAALFSLLGVGIAAIAAASQIVLSVVKTMRETREPAPEVQSG